MHEITNKLLAEPCWPQHASYCPTMDLVAVVTKTQTIDVWRFNGQRAFGLGTEGEDPKDVAGVAWRSDGQMLAIACSDGAIRLINSFNGKIAHRLQATQHPTTENPNFSSSQRSTRSPTVTPLPSVSILSWTSHFADAARTRYQIDSVAPNVSLDDLLGLNADVTKLLRTKKDLPRELAGIDIETSLPKLSSLPATGADDDVFSTRNSIDSIFHPENASTGLGKGKLNAIDVLLIGFRDCSVHIRIFNSFEIGSIDVSHALAKGLKGRGIIRHASHPYLSTHFVLVEAEADGHTLRSSNSTTSSRSFHLLSLDLRFIAQTSHNLPLLATKATQLQNLLRYLAQINTQMTQELKAAFDLPSKFLANVNESIAEHDQSADFATAAFHLVTTGECDPRLKEWLVDEVGERGLKRWEKAVGDCLDMVRRMASECLLPALERCQVVLSRLDGLSRFAGTATRLGINENGIKAIRETINVLTILSEDLLRDVCLESREFGSFIKWLKWEAEVEALEEGSERADELRDTYSGEPELRIVLEYISGALRSSRITRYTDAAIQEPNSGWDTRDNDDAQFYAHYKKSRTSIAKKNRLPTLGQLLSRLNDRSEKVFARIAETLKTSVMSTYVAELPKDIEVTVMDVRIIPSKQDFATYVLHVLGRSKGDEGALSYMILQMQDGTGRSLRWTSPLLRQLPVKSATSILDVKFVDDDALIVLAAGAEGRQILWHAMDAADDGISSKDKWQIRHVFDHGQMSGGMIPASLEVNGRKGRRAVTVLDDTGMGFMVLDLDSAGDAVAEEAEEGDEVMTG